MKKLAFTLLALVMLFTAVFPCSAFAEIPDFSDMTDEEIQEIIDAARNELVSRKLEEEDAYLLVDQDGVQIYLTGNYTLYDYDDPLLDLEAVIINNTDSKIGVHSDICCVNGWDVDFYGATDITAGKKKKCEFELQIGDADISTFEEVEDFEISFVVYNADTYDDIFTSDVVTLHFGE